VAHSSGEGHAPGTLSSAIWPGRFSDRVILVTGAAGGLGTAARSRLEAEGATVIAADAVPPDAADPGRISFDVRDRAAWIDAVSTIVREHHHLDGALFCHGVQGPEFTVADMPVDGWVRCMDINLTGSFHGLAAILPVLSGQGYGRVAVLSSIAAREGNPYQAAYSCSKAAVIALVKTAAKETAKDGVTVNAIAPSMFDTPLLKGLSPERNAQLLARVPMGRIGQPEEFAGLAAWLLSDEASYMTGQTLDLSGGRNTA
jgi:NAD(P)-dependent dehydrogenase (short-subunit alcohol dehydrogenase family)